jgi:hypothetical protein
MVDDGVLTLLTDMSPLQASLVVHSLDGICGVELHLILALLKGGEPDFKMRGLDVLFAVGLPADVTNWLRFVGAVTSLMVHPDPAVRATAQTIFLEVTPQGEGPPSPPER